MIRNTVYFLAFAALIHGFVIDGDGRGGWIIEEDLTLEQVVSQTKVKISELQGKSNEQKLKLAEDLQKAVKSTNQIKNNAQTAVSDEILTLLNTVDSSLGGKKVIDTCVDSQNNAIKHLDRTPLTSCKQLEALSDNIAQYEQVEKKIASAGGYCMTSASLGPQLLQECIQNRLDDLEEQLNVLNTEITNAISVAQYNTVYCIENAQSHVLMSVKSIITDFQGCVDESPVVTIEELIDELKPLINEIKSKASNAVSEGTTQTATIASNIDNVVSSAVVSVAQQITELSYSGLLGLPNNEVCQIAQKDSVNNVDRTALQQCRTSSTLSAISSKLSLLSKLEVTIGGIAGKCLSLKGEAITAVKICMLEILNASQKEIENIENEVKELQVQALTDAINCANTEAYTIISKIEVIVSEWNKCIENNVDYTVEEIIDELKPSINELKQQIKETTTELSNEITAINEEIDSIIAQPKVVLNERFEEIETKLSEHIRSDMHIPECVQRQEELLTRAKSEMSSIDLCRSVSVLGGISGKIGEMKKIETTISGAPGNCVSKVGSNAAEVKECILEAMHVARVQMNKMVQEINANIAEIKKETSNCSTRTAQMVWMSIFGLTGEFETCVQKHSGRTIEEIIDELSPAINTLKQQIRETANQISDKIVMVNEQINVAISEPKVILNERFHEITAMVLKTEVQAQECVSRHESLVNSAKSEMAAIDLCRSSTNLQSISAKIAEIKKIEATISAATGNCVGVDQTNSVKVKNCILEAMHIARVEMNNLVQSTTATFNKVETETSTCSSQAAQIVWKSILALTQEFEICIQKHISITVEQIIDEFTPSINELKALIKKTSTELSDEITTIHEQINSAVTEPQAILNNEFEKLSLMLATHMESDSYIPDCVSEHENLVARAKSEMAAMDLCRTSTKLNSISAKIGEMKKIEATISGTSGSCVATVGSNPDKVKECIQEAIHITNVQMNQLVQGIEVTISQVKSESSLCASDSAKIVWKSILGLTGQFEACVQKHLSITIEQVIDQLTPAINELKSQISGSVTDLSVEIALTNQHIQKAVSEPKAILTEKFTEMSLFLTNHVESESHVPECVSRYQELANRAKSEMAAIDICRSSQDLNVLIEKIGDMKKIQATISASPGKCIEEVGTNSARVKQCIQEDMHIARVQMNEMSQFIDVTIRKIKNEATNCATQSAQIVWKSIVGLTGEFDICVQRNIDITIENIINELTPSINELKSQITETVSEISIEILNTNQYINSVVSEPKALLTEKLSETNSMLAKHVESEAYTPDCVSRHEELVTRAQSEMAALDLCRSSPALNEIIAKVGEMKKIQATISGTSGYCVAEVGTNSAHVKECMQEAIHSARVQMFNLVKDNDVAIAQIKQESSNCATQAAQTVWKSILGLTGEFDLCLQKYASITVEDIIDQMNPEINSIKALIVETYTQFSNEISTTNNYINSVVSEPKTVLIESFNQLSSTVNTNLESDKYIPNCITRQEELVSRAETELSQIDLCRTSSTLNNVIAKISEMKKIEATISGAPGSCVKQVGANSSRVKKCIQEALHVTKVEMNNLVQTINQTITQIKSEASRCATQAAHIVAKSVFAITEEFEICVIKSPVWTVEQVIDEVKPAINEMKSVAQKTMTQLSNKVQTASQNVNQVVKSAKTSVTYKISAATAPSATPCLLAIEDSVSNLNTDALEVCRVSSKLSLATFRVSELAKIQAVIGAAPGKCVSTEGTAPTKVKLCIDKALSNAQNTLATSEKSVGSYVQGAITDSINCSNTAGQSILKKLEEILSKQTSC